VHGLNRLWAACFGIGFLLVAIVAFVLAMMLDTGR